MMSQPPGGAPEEAVGNALMGGEAGASQDPMALIQMLLESGQITPEQIPQILQMLGGALQGEEAAEQPPM